MMSGRFSFLETGPESRVRIDITWEFPANNLRGGTIRITDDPFLSIFDHHFVTEFALPLSYGFQI